MIGVSSESLWDTMLLLSMKINTSIEFLYGLPVRKLYKLTDRLVALTKRG